MAFPFEYCYHFSLGWAFLCSYLKTDFQEDSWLDNIYDDLSWIQLLQAMQAAWIPSKKPKKRLGFSCFFSDPKREPEAKTIAQKRQQKGQFHGGNMSKRPIRKLRMFWGSWFTHQMHQTMKTHIKQILLIPRIRCSLAFEKNKKKTQQNKCQRYGSGRGDGVFSRPVLSKQNRWIFNIQKIGFDYFMDAHTPHA